MKGTSLTFSLCAALVFCLAPVAGLAAEPSGVLMISPSSPPAPRSEARPPRPAARAVWIDGHWALRDGLWVWIRGYWDTSHPGQVWHPGYWLRGEHGYDWISGHW